MRLNNTFYNIDYMKYQPVRELPPDTKISGYLYTVDDAMLEDFQKHFPRVEILETVFMEGGYIVNKKGIIFQNQDRKEIKKYCIDHDIRFRYSDHLYITKSSPEGFLFSGWGTGYRTKIKAEDLPESFILLHNYKKHGYIQTAGVTDIFYKPSPFHNHTYKDDFIYLSYDKPLDPDNLWDSCKEYVFGGDIVALIFAVEKYSPEVKEKVQSIKERMVEQYNLYLDEMKRMDWREGDREKISQLEELL